MTSKNQLNANVIFLTFAALGLILSLGIKLIFHASEKSFYPTLGICALLLMIFHRFCYVVITKDKFRDLGAGKKLTEAAVVDSCYYLGFVYTLIILVTTFINIGQQAENIQVYNSNLNALMDILNRFCVGLFTTGYGLVARIHLSNLIEIEELDTDGLQNKLNTKTQALIQLIETGILSIESLIAKSNQSISDSISLANNSINQNTAELAKDAGNISSKLKLITKKIEEQIPNFDMTSSTNAVVEHLTTTASSVDSLNISINKVQTSFNDADKTASNAVTQFAGTIQTVASQYTQMSSQIQSFSNEVNKFTQNLISSEEASKELISSIKQLGINSKDTGTNLLTLNPALDNIRNRFQDLSIQINDSEKQLLKIKDIVFSVEGKTNTELDKFMQSINSVIKSLESRNSELGIQLGALEKSFKQLEIAAKDVSLEIQNEKRGFWNR